MGTATNDDDAFVSLSLFSSLSPLLFNHAVGIKLSANPNDSSFDTYRETELACDVQLNNDDLFRDVNRCFNLGLFNLLW